MGPAATLFRTWLGIVAVMRDNLCCQIQNPGYVSVTPSSPHLYGQPLSPGALVLRQLLLPEHDSAVEMLCG